MTLGAFGFCMSCQELSNGMLGFNNSLKIADVPFPFPYAQLLTLALVAFSCFIPVYVSVFTQDVCAHDASICACRKSTTRGACAVSTGLYHEPFGRVLYLSGHLGCER
eukprot:196514-Amphidinium_carterae.1